MYSVSFFNLEESWRIVTWPDWRQLCQSRGSMGRQPKPRLNAPTALRTKAERSVSKWWSASHTDHKRTEPQMSLLSFRRRSLHRTTREYGRLFVENLDAVAGALHHED